MLSIQCIVLALAALSFKHCDAPVSSKEAKRAPTLTPQPPQASLLFPFWLCSESHLLRGSTLPILLFVVL